VAQAHAGCILIKFVKKPLGSFKKEFVESFDGFF